MSEGKQNKFRIFSQVYLTREDRLVEALCGVIMVLTMISYLRLSLMDNPHTEMQKILILVPLGANAAWGIIDGIMYVLTNLIQRGRIYKLYSSIRSKESKEANTAIRNEFKSSIIGKLNEKDQSKIYDEIQSGLNDIVVKKPNLITKRDIVVIIYTFLLVVLVAVIVILPFLFINDFLSAFRLSQVIGIVLLFCFGYLWGKYASKNKIRSGIGITIIGIAIVLTTISLGG
ncbi:MAG: VIT1/CCC1 transporter family protein [Nitrosarchaeum sp.]